jgi:rhamnosyltransferase
MGRKWYIDDTVTMAYRQHSANDTGARGSFSGVKRRVSLIADGWYRKQVEDMTKLVLALNPEEPAARSWQGLSSSGKDGVLWRIRRIAFVASKGRRRLLDRIVLMSAIIFGYL